MKGLRKAFVFGFAAAVLILAGIVPTGAVVGPNINISKQTGYQGETTIAIDPTNPNRMFASSNINSGVGMFAAYSTDGGATWAYTDPVDKTIGDGDADNVPAACCDPIAVFDQFGNLYLAYLSSSIAVRVVVSTNGGQSFSGTNFAGEEIANIDVSGGKHKFITEREEKGGGDDENDVINQSGDQPTIVTGPSFFAGEASVWVSWNGGGVIRAAGTRASGLGAITPFDNTFITTPVSGNFGDIEIGPIGQVLVTAQMPYSGQGPSNINVSLDPDGLGPANFTQQTPISLDHKPFYRSLGDAENFGAAILVTATNVGGFDVIPAQPNRTVDAEADLSWNKTGGAYNGRVYLAYTQETAPENNDLDILVRYSDNNGATWSAPVRANDDATTHSQFFPRIEVDQVTGKVAVAFYDCRNDAAGTDGTANTETQVFGTYSANGGVNFTANELISQGSSLSTSFANGNNYGDYNGMAFRNNQYFYIWADNSNSTADNPNGTRTSPDIYTAKVTIVVTASNVAVSGRVLTADGAGVRNAVVTLTDPNGSIRRAVTSAFGYYRFEDVEAGQTYVVGVASKRFVFSPRTISVSDELTDLDFVAEIP